MSTRDRQREVKARLRELQVLLHDWDPVGVGSDGPVDEYDCIAPQLLQMLFMEASTEEIVAFLRAELTEHLGLAADTAQTDSFAKRLQWWFSSAS